jgi:hypothetical protein
MASIPTKRFARIFSAAMVETAPKLQNCILCRSSVTENGTSAYATPQSLSSSWISGAASLALQSCRTDILRIDQSASKQKKI